MESKDILSVLAVLLSPLIAIQVEKFIERSRSNKSRKVEIFKSLMATRGEKLSREHVYALNRIDLEFSGDKKYERVINAWKEYFDILLHTANTDEEFAIWNSKVNELLVNLLFEMGTSLNYNFDRVLIRRNIYSPVAHAEVEREETIIRKSLIRVLNGDLAISIQPIVSEAAGEQAEKQAELQTLLIDYYKNEKPMNVKIIKNE